MRHLSRHLESKSLSTIKKNHKKDFKTSRKSFLDVILLFILNQISKNLKKNILDPFKLRWV